MARTCCRLSEVFTSTVDGVRYTWTGDFEDMPDIVLHGHVSDEKAVQVAIKAIAAIDSFWAPEVRSAEVRVVYEWSRFLVHSQGCDPDERRDWACNCDDYGWWIDSSPSPKPFFTPTTTVSFHYRTIPTPQEV